MKANTHFAYDLTLIIITTVICTPTVIFNNCNFIPLLTRVESPRGVVVNVLDCDIVLNSSRAITFTNKEAKMPRKSAKWKIYKDDAYCFEQILEAEAHKTATVRPLTSHHITHPNKTNKTGEEVRMNS